MRVLFCFSVLILAQVFAGVGCSSQKNESAGSPSGVGTVTSGWQNRAIVTELVALNGRPVSEVMNLLSEYVTEGPGRGMSTEQLTEKLDQKLILECQTRCRIQLREK